LECLSLDFPTICFFPCKLNFIHSENKKDFITLKKHNLIFFNELELANFINKNYQNLDAWWNSVKIKKIKKEFCNKYSKRNNKKTLLNLKKFSYELQNI